MKTIKKDRDNYILVQETGEAMVLPPNPYEFFYLDATSKYMWDLMRAILNVKPYYIQYKDYLNRETLALERVFAYELYHQWSNVISKYSGDDKNLVINGEIKKCFKYVSKQPDLVLHEMEKDRQEIVVEIKRRIDASGNKIKDDLEKLKSFLAGKINQRSGDFLYDASPFKCGVFIMTDAKIKNLLSKLKNQKKAIHTITSEAGNLASKLYCLCYSGTDIEYVTLERLNILLQNDTNDRKQITNNI